MVKVNICRNDRITGDGVLLNQISKLLFRRVALFQRCTWSIMTCKGGKSGTLKKRINTGYGIKRWLIQKSLIDGGLVKRKGKIEIKIRRKIQLLKKVDAGYGRDRYAC